MHIIKVKAGKSVAIQELAKTLKDPLIIMLGQDCPRSLAAYILSFNDRSVLIEDILCICKSMALIQKKPINVIIWTNEVQKENQQLISALEQSKDIQDAWLYCLLD